MTLLAKQYKNIALGDFRRSKPLPKELYSGEDFPCLFYPRINGQAEVADEGAWEFRDDLKAAGDIDLKVGTINETSGNLLALWCPEALPDRLRILAYAIEYGLFHDDIVDELVSAEEFNERNNASGILRGSGKHDGQSWAKKSLQAKMMLKILEIDKYWGQQFIDSWGSFYNVQAAERSQSHQSLVEYLELRYRDAGADVWIIMLLFGGSSPLTQADLQPIRHILILIGKAAILVNDYYSWEKEYKSYVDGGQLGSLVNAVSVLMRTNEVDAVTAKSLLRAEIVKYEEQYCTGRDAYIRENCPELEILRLFELVEFSQAGNIVWHSTSARYEESAPKPRRKNIIDALPSNIEGDEQGGSIVENEMKGKLDKTPLTMNSGTHTVGVVSSKDNTQVLHSEVKVGEVTSVEACTVENTPKEDCPESGNGLPYSISPCRSIDDQIVSEPYTYVSSLPAKRARDTLIDALDNWYHVSDRSLATIRKIIETTHNVSLMFDDVEDQSPTRRGYPATHLVFGTSQTINTATYYYTKCLDLALSLSNEAVKFFSYELRQLHLGQGLDLHWTYHCKAPTEADYFRQAEQKTGGLFRMASKLMQAEATQNKHINVDILMTLLGRLYQVRDDYQDIASTDSTSTEGIYTDLDQGSFTLPIIHTVHHQAKRGRTELLSVLRSPNLEKRMSLDMKKLIIKMLEEAGSLEYTRKTVLGLHAKLKMELEKAEEATGIKNCILGSMLHRLEL